VESRKLVVETEQPHPKGRNPSSQHSDPGSPKQPLVDGLSSPLGCYADPNNFTEDFEAINNVVEDPPLQTPQEQTHGSIDLVDSPSGLPYRDYELDDSVVGHTPKAVKFVNVEIPGYRNRPLTRSHKGFRGAPSPILTHMGRSTRDHKPTPMPREVSGDARASADCSGTAGVGASRGEKGNDDDDNDDEEEKKIKRTSRVLGFMSLPIERGKQMLRSASPMLSERKSKAGVKARYESPESSRRRLEEEAGVPPL
jgi:hypothetical protein